MVPWSTCSECGEPVVPDGVDTYLMRVLYDEWRRIEQWVCGACFQDVINWAFFTPTPEGDEDLWGL